MRGSSESEGQSGSEDKKRAGVRVRCTLKLHKRAKGVNYVCRGSAVIKQGYFMHIVIRVSSQPSTKIDASAALQLTRWGEKPSQHAPHE